MANGTVKFPYKVKDIPFTLGQDLWNNIHTGLSKGTKIISATFTYTEGLYYSLTVDHRDLVLTISNNDITLIQAAGVTGSRDLKIRIVYTE